MRQLTTEALRYVEVVGEKLLVVSANVCRVFITWKTKIIITNIMMERIE